MKIYTIPAGVLRANSYLLTEDGENAVCIDCGGREPLAFAGQKGLKIQYVLLTHGHFDHIGGCAAAQAAGAKIGCLTGEDKIIGTVADLAKVMGIHTEPFRIDFTVQDGDALDLCGMHFTVISTPGHTRGGCCYESGDSLFTGDTLFYESVGRTDFPGGDAGELRQSVQKLLSLEGEKTVYPGHDQPTTLSHERKYNPYSNVRR